MVYSENLGRVQPLILEHGQHEEIRNFFPAWDEITFEAIEQFFFTLCNLFFCFSCEGGETDLVLQSMSNSWRCSELVTFLVFPIVSGIE